MPYILIIPELAEIPENVTDKKSRAMIVITALLLCCSCGYHRSRACYVLCDLPAELLEILLEACH